MDPFIFLSSCTKPFWSLRAENIFSMLSCQSPFAEGIVLCFMKIEVCPVQPERQFGLVVKASCWKLVLPQRREGGREEERPGTGQTCPIKKKKPEAQSRGQGGLGQLASANSLGPTRCCQLTTTLFPLPACCCQLTAGQLHVANSLQGQLAVGTSHRGRNEGELSG